MTERVDSAARSGNVPEEIRVNHKGFSEWSTGVTSKDHQPIVQVAFHILPRVLECRTSQCLKLQVLNTLLGSDRWERRRCS
jgi:hypothetical protein